MEFDPTNNVVKLCAQGMDMEGKGKPEEATKLFLQGWNEATNDFEKFTAAHYVARHQKSVNDKLKWDETALQLALKINNDTVKGTFPSLYLNIAKCYEDLNDLDNAKKNYDLALSFANLLPDNGYGNMVKGGIMKGIARVTE
jgi:tetratricopeptide (TPR) repeat protein